MKLELLIASLVTPVGPLSVVLGERTASSVRTIVGAGFCDAQSLLVRMKTADDRLPKGCAPGAVEFAHVTRAVEAYFAGDLSALEALNVEQTGGQFRQRAWAALRRVPAGETVTYSQLAELALSPAAVRAAGSACATNLIAPFVPCHRVIRTDGGLGEYAFGRLIKEKLLQHEQTHSMR